MDFSKELTIACDLAQKSGAIALHMRNQITVRNKPNGLGPVTDADVAIEDFITQQLKHHFPHDRIIGEESYVDNNAPITKNRTWFIDPIDGTSSYITNGTDFVTMIGLAIDGIARVGVVFHPSTSTLYRGLIHDDPKRSFADIQSNGKTRLLCPGQDRSMPSNLVILSSRRQRSLRQEYLIQQLNPERIIYRSSIGLKAMMIAEGKADLYIAWSSRIKMWDTCAPTCIVNAAGCQMSFVDGQPLHFTGSINHGRPLLITHFLPNTSFLDELARVATKTFI